MTHVDRLPLRLVQRPEANSYEKWAILTFIDMFWLTVQALPPHQQLSWQWLRLKFSCDDAKPIFSTLNAARGKRCTTAQASVTCHITPHAPKLLAVREWNSFLAMNGRRQ